MFYFIILLIFRAIRRQSLSEIGFGRLDTYTKLDKLGEVNTRFEQVREFFMPQPSVNIGKILQNSNIEIVQFYSRIYGISNKYERNQIFIMPHKVDWNILSPTSGHLRHGVQGQVPADGHHRGPQGDPAGARGGGPLHRHQGGLTPQRLEARQHRWVH